METNKPQSEQSFLQTLTNEEIFMIHNRFEKYEHKLLKMIKERRIPVEVNTPFGKAMSYRPVTDKEIQEFESSDYLRVVRNVATKLKNYADLIKDAEPQMAEMIDNFR